VLQLISGEAAGANMPDIEVVTAADRASLAPFDAVIDVRSPSEFAEDHVPGAISLPVLSDAERAEVGTTYVQISRFTARRMGAALIARNVARHLETALADRDGAWRPLVYCWRGGQRSGAMATILSQVGWRTAVLAGGYRTYRRYVSARLYDAAPPLRLVLIEGRTGSGKSEVLGRLAQRGVQALDLEGLAEHRGSVFGALPGRPQPSQKLFESRLVAALDGLDLAQPIVAEAEASKIGELMTPPAIWKAMAEAPRVTLAAPAAARAAYLAAAYAHLARDPDAFEAALGRLPNWPGRERVAAWRAMLTAGDLEGLALELIERHYDPAYDRAARRRPQPRLAEIVLGGLAPADFETAADAVSKVARAWGGGPGGA